MARYYCNNFTIGDYKSCYIVLSILYFLLLYSDLPCYFVLFVLHLLLLDHIMSYTQLCSKKLQSNSISRNIIIEKRYYFNLWYVAYVLYFLYITIFRSTMLCYAICITSSTIIFKSIKLYYMNIFYIASSTTRQYYVVYLAMLRKAVK